MNAGAFYSIIFMTKLRIIILLVFFSASVNAQELWPEKEHSAAPVLTAKTGLNFLYAGITGYGNTKDSYKTLWQYNIELSAGKEIPVFSRLYWASTSELHVNPDSFKESGSTDSSYSSLIELKTPFTVNFLSHDTTFFFQYKNNGNRYEIKHKENVIINNGTAYSGGTALTAGEKSQFFALAIDTPVTRNDSGSSYSRFGIYYQSGARLREATIDNDPKYYLLDVAERHFGIFMDMMKPVLVEGFYTHIYLQAGYGFRKIGANNLGFSDNRFDGYRSLLFLTADFEASYRFNLSENTGLILLAGYNYNNIIVIKNGSTKAGSFDNEDKHQFKASLMFDVHF